MEKMEVYEPEKRAEMRLLPSYVIDVEILFRKKIQEVGEAGRIFNIMPELPESYSPKRKDNSHPKPL